MSFSQTEWQTIEELFEEATGLPRKSQRSFLLTKCEDLPHLFDEVMSLLEAHYRFENAKLEQDDSGSICEQLETLTRKLNEGSASAELDDVAEWEINISRIRDAVSAAEPDLELGSMLARGGNGVVFEGRQLSLQRPVAVKVLLNSNPSAQKKKRFAEELKATAKVKHRNVVEIYSVYDTTEISFFVMELLNGESLKDILKERERIPATEAARIALDVCRGLDAVHQQDLVHRDVKPANVMVADEGHDGTELVKIIDFGVVRDAGDLNRDVTQDQMLIGTPAYMSPEQIHDPTDVDSRSDVFAVGVMLYEMLTGTRPFNGAPHMIAKSVERESLVSIRDLDDRIPRDIESICLKAMRAKPINRYASADEMGQDLQRFLDGEPTKARPVTNFEKFFRWCSRNARLAVAIGLAALLFLSLVIGALGFAWTVSAKNREILEQRTKNRSAELARLLDAEPGAMLQVLDAIEGLERDEESQLRQIVRDEQQSVLRRLNAAVTLSTHGKGQLEILVELIDQVKASPEVCNVIQVGLASAPDAREQLIRSFNALQKKEDDQDAVPAMARRIILLAGLGQWAEWRRAAENRQNPTLMTEVIHAFADWHPDLTPFTNSVETRIAEPWVWTVLAALNQIAPESLTTPKKNSVNELTAKVNRLQNYITFLYAEMLEQRLNPNVGRKQEPHPDCQDFTNAIRMIRIRPGTSRLGKMDDAKRNTDHPPRIVKLTREYYLSETEITVGLFREFIEETRGSFDNWKEEAEFDNQVSPTERHPIQSVSWYEAIEFCNWFSTRNGLQPAYRKNGTMLIEKLEDGKTRKHPDWQLIEDSTGFRLPTEAEWEYGARNDSQTRFFFGSDAKHFEHYGLASNRRVISSTPVKSLLPNSRGLFGTLGNVWEWNHDFYPGPDVDNRPLTDPTGSEQPDKNQFGRVIHGAGISTDGGPADSESRGFCQPYSQFRNLGFRLARWAESGPQLP